MAAKQDHSADHTDAQETGKKGVSQDQVGSGKKDDPNNFANDRERASAAGKKGGQANRKTD